MSSIEIIFNHSHCILNFDKVRMYALNRHLHVRNNFIERRTTNLTCVCDMSLASSINSIEKFRYRNIERSVGKEISGPDQTQR